MITSVQLASWGTSTALRIPKPILKEAGLSEKSIVTIETKEDGSLVIKPKVTLETLFTNWDGEPPEKVEWFEEMLPEGREIL